MTFPVYRKYADNSAYFEIVSQTEFRELKRIGRFYELHHIHARILPERNYLSDLISNSDGYYVESHRAEFEKELKWCADNLQRIG
jgi:hypothetical protein